VYGPPSAPAIPNGAPAPGYLFYGEETYLADVFIRDLQARLIPPDSPDFHLDTFHLDESKWADIVDAARTMPFFFSPWRIVVVRFAAKVNSDRSREKESNGETSFLSEGDKKILKSYFSSPAARTVMVFVFQVPAKRGQSTVRIFSSLPGVVAREVKPLRERELLAWIDAKARSLGKALAPEAGRRLLEIVGSDLRLMDNEIEKLAVYVGDERVIDLEAVNGASAWVKEFDAFELDEGLETGDLRKCLVVLDNLFKASEKPEQILYRFVKYFRDVLSVRVRLEDKPADRKAIFKTVYPYIQESFGDLYRRKFTALFAAAEGISRAEFARLMESLARVDSVIKTTDMPPQAAFEAFLFEYCEVRKKGKATSRASG
jgi:DNA polymerase III delta subunit